MEKEKTKNNFIGVVQSILIILVVVAVGLFCVNQTFSYIYKAEFLKTPCKLCGDLNPEVTKCIRDMNTKATYPDYKGDFIDPTTNIYSNISLKI